MNEMLEQCRAMMDAMSGFMGTSHSTGMSGMMPMGGVMGPSIWLFGLLSVALLAAVGVGVGWLLFARSRHRGDTDARHLLDSRYVRGELDRDTYLRMRSDLADAPSEAG